jgi:NitT/TauT family transport system permease protein
MIRIARRALQWVVSLGILVAAWQWVVVPHTNRLFISPPLQIYDRLKLWASDGQLLRMVGPTLTEALVGLIIGAGIGIILACVVTLAPSVVGKVIEPAVVAVYAAPKFAVIPLIFVWIGAGLLPRTLFVVIGVFAIIFVNTVSGVRTVDQDQIRMLQMFGASRRHVATKLLIPHAMGYVTTGLKFSASFAVVVAIGGEMLFGTTQGLGGELNQASELFYPAGVLSAIIVSTVLATIIIGGAGLLGRRTTWVATEQTPHA